MKRIVCVVFAVLLVSQACSKIKQSQLVSEVDMGAGGKMSVTLRYDSSVNKSLSDYNFVLNDEITVKDIQVLVFDHVTGELQRSATIGYIDEVCEFTLPVGSKLVYALLNGPDVSGVRMLGDLYSLTDNLSDRDYHLNGFVMLGSAVCHVEAGEIARPNITVSRIISRVVLRSLKCNVARQYEGMIVDCVFLGNAAVERSLGGESLCWVNMGGYADVMKKQPIGLDGVVGQCPDYLYKAMGKTLEVGQVFDWPLCLYCYPNETSDFTCLYILATIGGKKCYYKVPLDKGLAPNVTCAVDVEITNIGAELPPDGVLQRGEIVATVSIEGWSMGYLYNAEF